MIELHMFPNNKQGFNFSPFCTKAEVYLKITNTPYVHKVETTPQKAPKGKMPFIVDGEEIVGDSALIIEHLAKKYSHELDNWLSQEQHAIGLSVVRMLEEHLYFALLYSRWVSDDVWPRTKRAFFGQLPPIISTLIPAMVRRLQKKLVWAQGVGRHSEEEIYTMAKDDIRALGLIMGEKRFLLGDKATSYDASVYGFVKNLMYANLGTELESEAKTNPKFRSYCEEIERLF